MLLQGLIIKHDYTGLSYRTETTNSKCHIYSCFYWREKAVNALKMFVFSFSHFIVIIDGKSRPFLKFLYNTKHATKYIIKVFLLQR